MVLIVEDDAPFRRMIKETVHAHYPFSGISEASDGIEAFQAINARIPDIIFMDIRLPGESGLVLTKKIKDKYPGVVIVILTSYDQREYRKSAFQNGATYFLQKGVTTPGEIINVLDDALLRKGNGYHMGEFWT